VSVAILLPVYNDLQGLNKTLASIEKCIGEFSVVVIDDGSQVKVVLDKEYDFNILVINLDENSGIETALNIGIEHILTTGVEFIARLDSGDEVYPERFVRQVNFFSEHLDVDVVGSYIDVVDEKGRFLYQQKYPVKHDEICRGFFYQNQLCHPAVMFRVSIFAGGLRYPLDRPAAEDFALFVKASRQFKFENIPESLTIYQFSESSISSTNRRRQCMSRLKVQFENTSFGTVHFYCGIWRTLCLILMPRKLSIVVKKLLSICDLKRVGI
jgi:glycosyltransferase involved in cell wall biosynthesis